MTNKEKEIYFYTISRQFATTVNRLIPAFIANKIRYDDNNDNDYFKYWLILMGLMETAYIIKEDKL